MQVKKFEAPTIQEALDVIKRELGPEAIILQTKKLKKGFGLMSRESVEVTAAVSERSIQKKSFTETRLKGQDLDAIKRMPASKQGDLHDKYVDRHAQRDSGQGSTQKRLTATRYADIDDAAPAQARARSSGAGATAARQPAQASPQAAAAIATAQAARAQAEARAAANQERNAPLSGANSAYNSRGLHQAQTLEDVAQGRISRDGAGAVMGHLGAGMSVEEELKHLKRMIEDMKTTQDTDIRSGTSGLAGGNGAMGGSLPTAALHDAFEQLVLNGMDKRYALTLVKKVAFEIGDERARNPEYVLDQLAVEIMQSTQIVSPLSDLQKANRPQGSGPQVIALVGPTGVGKTTTVAKMASEAVLRRNLKVGLINLDSYKVAACDQLHTYAKILNCPFRSVENADDLRVAIQDFAHLDLVIVDTTGRSQRDPAALKEMQELLGSVPDVHSQLVLSVTTRDNELYDMASRFAIFRPQGIIVSKLDEASIYGSIYNVAQKVKLPLLYFTTGQRVPEDIEEATRERVAALIMDL
jgi:flagellar biosynthesis protein FlhF